MSTATIRATMHVPIAAYVISVHPVDSGQRARLPREWTRLSSPDVNPHPEEQEQDQHEDDRDDDPEPARGAAHDGVTVAAVPDPATPGV